jgi:Flp pilus assembly pilin Flp
VRPTLIRISNSVAARFTVISASARVQTGQTMAEYAILIAVIFVVVIVAAILFGSSVSTMFNGASKHV